MRSAPVSLLGGFNRDDAPAWAVQDVVNWLPVVADQPGTRTQYKLRTPPGLSPYQRIGKGPIRGRHNAEGRLFVVSGQTLFEVSNKGVGIPRGTVPGVGRVRMAHNQVKNGNQLAIANGQSGYIYNTATQVFTRITDEGFPGAIDVVFINGYLFWIEPFGRFWLHSDLADGLSYNTLDRGEAESQPDRIVGVAVSQNDVLLFGERTTEFYGNTGQATGTFQSKGVTADVGCASLHTIQNLDNSVMWLGNDGVVYRVDGYRAVPISTRAVEKAIAQHGWASAFAFTWEDEGHKVYYLTFPDGETFGFDVVVGLWHRRESFGFNRWRLSCAVRWNRMWIGGDFQDGRLWQLKWRHPLEGDDELVSEYTSGVLHDDGNPLGLTEVELLFGTGGEPVTAGTFPVQPPIPAISGLAPDGVKGIGYEYAYTASGGTGELKFKAFTGELPAGLTLSTTGVLSGTPAGSGTYAFTVRVTDSNGMWAELSEVVIIKAGVVALATSSYLYERSGATLIETIPAPFAGLSRSLAFSSNGLYLAVGSSVDTRLRVGKLKADKSGYVELPVTGLPSGTVQGVDFSPDGQWLIAALPGSNQIRIYKVSADEVAFVTTASLNQASGPRFSRDGKWIVCGCGIDPPTRGIGVMPFNPITGLVGSAVHPPVSGGFVQSSEYSEWDPSGKYIAACNNGGVAVWRFKDASLALLHSQGAPMPSGGRGVSWSPDGRYLYTVAAVAVAGNRIAAYQWNGESLSAPVYPVDQPISATISDSSLSSDGKQLVIGLGGSNPGQALYVYDVSGTELTLAPRPMTTAMNADSVRWTGVPNE